MNIICCKNIPYMDVRLVLEQGIPPAEKVNTFLEDPLLFTVEMNFRELRGRGAKTAFSLSTALNSPLNQTRLFANSENLHRHYAACPVIFSA
jgi:hypothetical protein